MLIIAITNGDDDMIKALVAAGANPNVRDKDSMPAIALLAKNGRNDALKLLIEKGADVNLSSNDGYTAIHKSSEHNQKLTVSLLISNLANVNAQTHNGVTALMFAAQNGDTEIVKMLLKSNANTALLCTDQKNNNLTAKKIALRTAPRNSYGTLNDTAYKSIAELLTLPENIIDA